jgi:hypothetical protein
VVRAVVPVKAHPSPAARILGVKRPATSPVVGTVEEKKKPRTVPGTTGSVRPKAVASQPRPPVSAALRTAPIVPPTPVSNGATEPSVHLDTDTMQYLQAHLQPDLLYSLDVALTRCHHRTLERIQQYLCTQPPGTSPAPASKRLSLEEALAQCPFEALRSVFDRLWVHSTAV